MNKTLLIAAASFGAGYLIADYMRKKPRIATNEAEDAAAAAVGASWNCLRNPNGPGCNVDKPLMLARRTDTQPYNPDKSGFFNYATGGFPYSL